MGKKWAYSGDATGKRKKGEEETSNIYNESMESPQREARE